MFIIKKIDYIFISFFFAVLIFYQVIFNDLLPVQADTRTHLRWAFQFNEAILDGIWLPRWTYASHGGLGDPTFLFYQPLLYYLTAAINFFIKDIKASLLFSILLSNIILGLSFYNLFIKYTKKIYSLFCMLCVQILPIYFFLFAYHGSFPWVFASPFVFLLVYQSIHTNTKPHLIALWTFLLILSHILSALMIIIVLSVYKIFSFLNKPSDFKSHALWVIGLGCGLILSAFYLFPAITQQHLINPDGWIDDPTLDWRRAFAFPLFTYIQYGFRWFAIQYPFPLLATLMTISSLILVGISISSPISQQIKKIGFLALICLFFSSELAYPFYAHISHFEIIQWPYRFVMPASIFALAAVLLALSQKINDKFYLYFKFLFYFLLIIHFIFFIHLQINLAKEGKEIPDITRIMKGYFGQPEYNITSTDLYWKKYIEQGAWTGECMRNNVYCYDEIKRTHQWSASITTNKNIVLKAPIFYFPAWQVFVNGIITEFKADDNTGLILIPLQEGKNEILIKWRLLTAERYGIYITLFGFFMLCLITILYTQKKKFYPSIA